MNVALLGKEVEVSTARFIFVTGGVVSSLGKGIAAASIGTLLQARGYKVKLRKLEPYINVDPGTMSPYQHGEVYVTDDGAETDLDLGHYERFTGVTTTQYDAVSTGKIYSEVIARERRGDYLGATVQVIPHITDAIKQAILSHIDDADFVVCEIGGTVGDIEGLPFLEAIRQLKNELGDRREIAVHVTLVPYIPAAGELKTKPTQHSVKELQSKGIQPDILLCRSDRLIGKDERRKLALFCNIKTDSVIEALDVSTIYEAPLTYHEEGLDRQICLHFGLESNTPPDLSIWRNVVDRIKRPEGKVTIGVVGKYVELPDAYKSIFEALIHGGIANNVKVDVEWIQSEDLDEGNKVNLIERLGHLHGILIPGGFGERGTQGMLEAIQFARQRKIPFLGICLGMQLAVIETMRNVAGILEANSTEFGNTPVPVVGMLTEWMKGETLVKHLPGGDMGGTMRLGAYECQLKPGSKSYEAYGSGTISERHRHRYEVNANYGNVLEEAGMLISGTSMDGELPEMVELQDHPWFLATQAHPELKSRPFKPHPLFAAFVKAALEQERLV
ncbi:CTP synthase [Candidatus Bealeia paramacronuclearis]|uniref:CTP synthase n=1 Tax=Candidatus Bealeia paramacronuclearis TaxID=1921001 RepID=A0ABZ2C4U0_9PROT|nr:CTP synthase [Candidatus Bealeia paramacronuclearis]